MLVMVPIAHHIGVYAMHMLALAGVRLVLMESWSAEAGVELIERTRVTFTSGPPIITSRWIVDRLSALWGEELRVESPDAPQPAEARFLRLDSSRARERLGWRPRWNLERALESIVEWTRAYAAGEDATLAQIRAFEAVLV